MSDNQIVQYSGGALMPAMSMQDALHRYQSMIDFTRKIMQDGKDYGKIPGAGDKPTLLKPGAEKLCSFFGLAPEFKAVDKLIDFTNQMFYIQYECRLYHRGELVGSGLGSCNSQEKKYRYRNGERTCPACGKATIIKGKKEYGGGWLCFAKKGGCGAKYSEGDQAIEGQVVGQIENPDKADLLNTIDKMAQKRALVAAVLVTANASEFFTQDIEDYVDGSFVPAAPEHWQEHAPVAPVQEPVATMSLETAANVKTGDGMPYIEIDSDTLSHMATSITKKLARGGYDATEIDEAQMKRDACLVILQSRGGS